MLHIVCLSIKFTSQCIVSSLIIKPDFLGFKYSTDAIQARSLHAFSGFAFVKFHVLYIFIGSTIIYISEKPFTHLLGEKLS